MPQRWEIHLTLNPLPETEIADFEACCTAAGARALLIELARGVYMQQPMLSLRLEAPDLHTVLCRADALRESLAQAGYPCRRTKVEVPDTDAPQVHPVQAGFRPYFEWHGRVQVQDPAALRPLCEAQGAHLSRNALRGEPGRRFVTLREYGSHESFRQRVQELQLRLEAGGWPVLKTESEYCIHDTCTGLDAGWLTPELPHEPLRN